MLDHIFEQKQNQLLYHYTSVDSAKAILRSNCLRLSEFSKLNDSSEFNYSKNIFIDELKKNGVDVDQRIRVLLPLLLPNFEKNTTLLIGSLTESSDDVAMWERYAEGGRGCVLGIDADWLVNHAGVMVRKVVYEETKLRDFANASLLMLHNNFVPSKTDQKDIFNLASFTIADLFAFKHPSFKSEQEVRVGRMVIANERFETGFYDAGGQTAAGLNVDPLTINQRIGPYGETRFVDLPLGANGVRSAIKSIGLGPKYLADEKAFFNLLEEDSSKVRIWKSEVPLR